jgi:hypothetical protein
MHSHELIWISLITKQLIFFSRFVISEALHYDTSFCCLSTMFAKFFATTAIKSVNCFFEHRQEDCASTVALAT